MNKCVKTLFVIVTFPLLMLLGGCNSEDAFSVSKNPAVKLERIDIVALLIKTQGESQLTLMVGKKQYFKAVGHYSDGSSRTLTDLNVSNWHTSNPDVGRFDKPGVFTGVVFTGVKGGNTTLTAMKDGITSNTVSVNVCDLGGACIDIFDIGGGKLFTNSPSVAYLDSIGGSVNDATIPEQFGPVGDFYLFNWNNANALCATYNVNRIGGRTNWRLPTKDELKGELFDVFGNMLTARGWPIGQVYWSVTLDGSRYHSADEGSYYNVDLGYNGVHTHSMYGRVYVSCVSEP